MMRACVAPRLRAATTYSRSIRLVAVARVTRMKPGRYRSAIAPTRTGMDGWKTTTMASSSRSPGTERMVLAIVSATKVTAPRKKADRSPMAPPTTIARTVTRMAISKETRAPNTSLDTMLRPMASVPKNSLPQDGLTFGGPITALGSLMGSTLAKTASRIMSPSQQAQSARTGSAGAAAGARRPCRGGTRPGGAGGVERPLDGGGMVSPGVTVIAQSEL